VHFGGGPQVAVMAPILIIRLREPALDPGFLALALNSGPVRSRLRADARGSNIQFLGKAEVGDIDIPVPPMPRQRAAVAYAAMAEQERQLHARLSALRSRALDGFFENMGGGHPPRRE
jgi:restriction endonuclease S subunit